METEGVMVKAEREEGWAVLAEGVGGGEMKSGWRGRSGKRTFERVAVENLERVVPMSAREEAESREDVVEASSVSEGEEVRSEPGEEEEEVRSEPGEEKEEVRSEPAEEEEEVRSEPGEVEEEAKSEPGEEEEEVRSEPGEEVELGSEAREEEEKEEEDGRRVG